MTLLQELSVLDASVNLELTFLQELQKTRWSRSTYDHRRWLRRKAARRARIQATAEVLRAETGRAR